MIVEVGGGGGGVLCDAVSLAVYSWLFMMVEVVGGGGGEVCCVTLCPWLCTAGSS